MTRNNPDISQYAVYLHQFMQRYIKISEQELNLFLPYFEVRTFAKRQIVLEQGQVDHYLNLVVKGLLRKYVVAGKNEKTVQLAIEGKVIQSEISFHTRTPSTMIIEALEPSVVVAISYDNMQLVLEHVPSAEKMGREMMTFLFIKKDARYFQQLNNTVRQRFLHYLKHHPQMMERVPQKILASYLEIKPETFSRLKHLLKS
jgi:CRP-like cAMP-binding protein